MRKKWWAPRRAPRPSPPPRRGPATSCLPGGVTTHPSHMGRMEARKGMTKLDTVTKH